MKKFPNVFEFTRENKGRWREVFFKNNHPLVLELACGGGEYSVALAGRTPEKNFLGIDIKGARLFKGAKAALLSDLPNVAFLRTHIDQIEEYFAPGEVSEIWITFPDPFLRNAKWKKRLTSSLFLSRYKKICPPGTLVHLKTDSPELFAFTLQTLADLQLRVLRQSEDVYTDFPEEEVLHIRTHYEKMHLANGRTSKYILFVLT